MMSHRIEMQLTFDAPVDRVWAAFTQSDLRSRWEASSYQIDARPGGTYEWTLPGHESHGIVAECEPERLLVQTEKAGPHSENRQTFRFESTEEGGTRLDLVHDGLPSALMVKSVTLGWEQAIADLHVLLKYDVAAERFARPMQHIGMWPEDLPEGLVVASIDEDGIAGRAGLEPGDLLLGVAGVPVFTRPELWVAMRTAQPGDKVDVEFVRASDRLSVQLVF